MKIKYVPTRLNLKSHYFTLGNLLPAYEWVCEANLSLRQNLADQAEVILALKILFYRSPFVLCQCLDQLIWPRRSICERCRDWRLPPVLSVVSSWQVELSIARSPLSGHSQDQTQLQQSLNSRLFVLSLRMCLHYSFFAKHLTHLTSFQIRKISGEFFNIVEDSKVIPHNRVELPINDACCVELPVRQNISLWQTRLWLLISDQVIVKTEFR